jgi:hypothetical protein
VLERFLEWNHDHVGKRSSSHRSAAFWYRDDVLYLYEIPVARFVLAPNGGWVLFTNHNMHWSWNLRWCLPDGDKERAIQLDNICVLGPAENAVSELEPLLQSAGEQLVNRGKWALEKARSLSTKTAHTYLTDFHCEDIHGRLVKKKNGQTGMDWYFWQVDILYNQLSEAKCSYEKLRLMFWRTDWLPYPYEQMGGELDAIIKRKADHYGDPATIAKRERQAARKEAARAFA